MKTINYILWVFFVLSNIFITNAQEQTKTDIFQMLSSDSLGQGKVIMHQDKRLETIILKENKQINQQITTTASGYRIQVFSSSDKTAKSDAYSVEKQIKELFPNQNIYVVYSSPSWKVRVGDFTIKSQALDFQTEIINNFPNLRSDVYVVKEQVIVPLSKK
jgi:SPOR domain